MKNVPLRRLVASVDNGAWGVDPHETASDATALCIRAADFAFNELRVDTSRAPTRGFDTRTLQRLQLSSGDIVLEKSGGGENLPVGRSVLFDHAEPAIPTNFAARLRPAHDVNSRYLVYLLRHLYESGATARCIKQTTGIQNLDTDAWLTTDAPRPSETEQRRIADFLDDRVSRIDRIIAARREQAELALRAQTAALTEATTPPADPTGWVRLKFSRVAVLNDGLVDPTVEPHASMALIAPNHIEKGTGRLISLESAESQGATSGKGLVRKGQIIYSKIRPSLRKAVVAPDDCLCSADAYAIEPRDEVVSRDYLLASLLGDYFTQQVIDASERVAMPKVNRDSLAEVFIWVPPRDVQERRVVALHNQARHLGLGLDLMTDSCARLIEYKSSLITAAVTGELDVSTAGSSIAG